MSRTLRLAFLLGLLVPASLPGQRQVPPPRTDAPLGDHIAYAPHQYRGANFWLTRSLGPTNLWNRWPTNRWGVEAHLAHCARAGVNVMRIYVDYRAFLWSRLFDAPSQPDAYADKVRAIMDLANRYEIGLIPVLFNPFGDAGGGLQCETCYCNELVPGDSSIAPAASPPGWALFTLNNDIPSAPPGPCPGGLRTKHWFYLSDPSDPMAVQVLYGSPFAPFDDYNPGLKGWLHSPTTQYPAYLQHGMYDFVNSVCQRIGASQGLLGYQVFNEPVWLGTVTTGYGKAVLEVLNLIEAQVPPNPRNPHGLKASIGSSSIFDYHNPNYSTGGIDLFIKGFGPPSKLQALQAWDFHVFGDTWVRNDQWFPLDAYGDVRRMHRYLVRAHNDSNDPGPSIHTDHLNRPGIGQDYGPLTSFTSEAGCRNVCLQVVNDVLHFNGRVDRDTGQVLYNTKSQGFLAWTIFPSDVAGGEGGPFLLPGGTVQNWREAEALKDRWRWNPLAGQNSVVAGVEGYSDALVPLLLTAPIPGSSDFIAVALFAENFDNQGEHGTATSPTLPNNPGRNALFSVAARVPPTGPIQWSSLYPTTFSPGPLILDDTRQSVRTQRSGDTPQTDPRWTGLAHPEVEQGDSIKCLLRIDLLGRQKMRNHIEPLRPRGDYLGKQGDEHVFVVAYSRPVAKSANVGSEPYSPDGDYNVTNGQYYFSAYKQSTPSDPAKYEVLVRRIRVSEGNPPTVSLEPETVLRTRGIRTELWHNGTSAVGTGVVRPITADSTGAAAIDPRIFSSPDPDRRDYIVLYRKSQDSWFDVRLTGYQSTGVDPTFEDPARWNVYPWEIFAQIWDGQVGNWILDANNNPKEFRVSRSFPGEAGDPMKTWQEQMKIQVDYFFPCSPQPCQGAKKNRPIERRLRQADFHPAVEPHGLIWREGGVLKASVVFKQLNTWVDETETWRYPSGYKVMSTELADPTGSFSTPVFVPDLYYPLSFDPSEPDSREAFFAHGEPRVVRCPSLALPLVRTFQYDRMFFAVDDPGINHRFLPETSVEVGGNAPFFVTNHESASNGTDGMVTAWLQFVGPSSVVLTASGVKGASSFASATTMAALTTTVDFESKVVGVTHVGNDRFRVVWLQGGILQRADLLLSASGLSFDAVVGVVQLAGNASKAVQGPPEPHLHSGRASASMTDRGVLFTHKGALRFVRL